jgi:4-diphosphocytidyl-2-C-methyl-D-erythritol kinase
MTSVTVRAPAKVNLQLSVGPRRADGYHDLITVFHAVALFDELTARLTDRLGVSVSGEGAAAVPPGRDNLAVRAVHALARETGMRRRGSPGVHLEIRKRIPVAAGLAGGSADAAAALVACNELWRAGLTVRELCTVGAKVGSDVPFALTGGTAIGQGRGEQLTSALVTGSYHWVLAFAGRGLATADVYATYDRLRAARAGRAFRSESSDTAGTLTETLDSRSAGGRPGLAAAAGPPAAAAGPPAAEPELSTDLMAALRSGDPAAAGPLLANDLQPAALSLMPSLRRTLAAGREAGALGALVSGSGPTCAFLARDARQASDIAVWLTGAGVCAGVATVEGPAPGAMIVPVVQSA